MSATGVPARPKAYLMANQSEKYGTLWSREELILAFELYCRIPFRTTRATNPEVIWLAHLIGRTPAAMARKLGNFGAFDPELKKRNIGGLPHGSKLDGEIWNEFHRDWSGLVSTAHTLRETLWQEVGAPAAPLSLPTGPSERAVTARQRLHQAFFRQAVLSSYEYRCCITGLPIPDALIASHIIPWSVDRKLRANPANGLSLSATFSRLFDSGLMGVDEDLKVCISSALLDNPDPKVQKLLSRYHRKPIRLPTRFLPDRGCIRWHLRNTFRYA